MPRSKVPLDELSLRSYHVWETQWLLLCAGDYAARRFNAMTIAWGSIGSMWGRPFVQVAVRPTRYTFTFMQQYPTFTVSAFAEEYRPGLHLLGTRSGRDGDKISAAGLTPCASENVAAPSFAEAALTLECRTIYWDDLKPDHFLDPAIDKNYPERDYHRLYFGEIVCVWRA